MDSTEKIAAALSDLPAKLAACREQVAALTAENGALRTRAKALEELAATLAETQAKLTAARKDASANAVRANGCEAELASQRATILKLQPLVDRVEEWVAARRSVEALLAGGRR